MSFPLPLDKDKHYWITQWLISEEYRVAAMTLTIIQLIVLPLLFILHSYRVIKGTNTIKYDNDHPLRLKYKIIDNLSLFAIIFSFIAGFITIANYASWLSHSSCRIITITQNVFWLWTKITIYLIIVLRLQAAFWGSIYKMSKRLKWSCYVLIALFSIILTIGTVLPHPYGVDSFPLPGTDFCLLVIPAWYACIASFLSIHTVNNCFCPCLIHFSTVLLPKFRYVFPV